MSMALGLVSNTRAPVMPGTVIRLTEKELSSDPTDQANTRVRAMFEAHTAPYQVDMSTQFGPMPELRNKILMLSLYPNVMNSKKSYRKEETGTFRSGMSGV